MKILITGADGFLGKQCVQLLNRQGHEVITTDKKGQVALLGDLSDSAFVASLPDVDAVVHCAAVQYVSDDLPIFNRKRYFYKNNILATTQLCKRYQNTATYLVNIATSMMYVQDGSPTYDIHSKMLGDGVYSQSKFQAFNIVNQHNIKHATIIPCIIGGIGREGLFVGFIKMIQRFGFVAFPGRGEHKVHMVHVSDVADLISLAVHRQATGIFNAAGPEPLSISEWVDQIALTLGKSKVLKLRIPLPIVKLISYLSLHRIIAKEQLLMLQMSHVLVTESSQAIGWKPKYDNRKIITDICNHIAQ